MTDTEKQIQDLVKAVSGMEKVQEITTKNVDKLVANVEKVLPVYAQLEAANQRIDKLEDESSSGIRPNTLKHILIYACMIIISFGTWMAVYAFETNKELYNHISEYKETKIHIQEEIKELKQKSNYNNNQIVYLKGAKANKPKSRNAL